MTLCIQFVMYGISEQAQNPVNTTHHQAEYLLCTPRRRLSPVAGGLGLAGRARRASNGALGTPRSGALRAGADRLFSSPGA